MIKKLAQHSDDTTIDPYIVIEYPDGHRVAERVPLGTTLEQLEDLWQYTWEGFCPSKDARIRVGLGHGFLMMWEGIDSAAVSKLTTKWLGYRDAKLPAFTESTDEVETGPHV